MVGIGLGYLEYYDWVHSIWLINNSEEIVFTPENFLNFDFTMVTRTGYITIARDEDDPPITSIICKTSTPPGDAYTFDYIAIKFLEEDTDGDGIPDSEDQCVDSDLSPTVVIDGCDSGVPNILLTDGCTISDKIAILADFRRAVTHYTNDLKKDGVITGKQKGAMQSCVGQGNVP